MFISGGISAMGDSISSAIEATIFFFLSLIYSAFWAGLLWLWFRSPPGNSNSNSFGSTTDPAFSDDPSNIYYTGDHR